MAYINGSRILSVNLSKSDVDEQLFFDNGVKAEHDRFYNEFQQNGTRNNYRNAFFQWTDGTYDPIYPITLASQGIDVFYYAKITDTKVPIIVLTDLTRTFCRCSNLTTIRLLDVAEHVNFSSDCFESCSKLTNITIEGTIGKSISFVDSPLLSLESLKSIIFHLKNYAGTESAHTQTLRLNNASWDLLNNGTEKPPSRDLWQAYIDYNLGWNVY